MLPKTLLRYQTRALNFYRQHCGGEEPTSAQICAALLTKAPDYVPSAFGVLKSTIASDQLARGNHEAAEAIRRVVNPVTAQGSKIPRKAKPKKIRSVPFADFKALLLHLRAGGQKDELASVILAFYLATRPCEMRTVITDGNRIHITGGKKNIKLGRGADRTLTIESSKELALVVWAARRMGNCPRTDAAIRDRLRNECRALWPRRKKRQPTLKSFRHQLGSSLKASGESAEGQAYVMGHQSTDSISVYGNRRSGEGLKVYVSPAEDSDLSKIRTPQKASNYGGRVLGQIELPASTREHLGAEMTPELNP